MEWIIFSDTDDLCRHVDPSRDVALEPEARARRMLKEQSVRHTDVYQLFHCLFFSCTIFVLFFSAKFTF